MHKQTLHNSQKNNKMLALSRADERSARAEPAQPIDLKPLCEEVLEAFLDAAARKQIDLGLEAAAVQANGYAWLLRELLSNLVDNAIRYIPAGGHVTLRCGVLPTHEGTGEKAFLEVEDDGPGVPEPERARMLERFYRLPGSAGDGNGLGLAIADEIARVHRSQLRIESSAHGRGLRCRLLLEPVRESSNT
jgi:two-component system sensor histidine kinase TctE